MGLKVRKTNIWKFIFIYLLFQPSLSKNFSGLASILIKYSDEILALLIICCLIVNRKKLMPYERKIIVLLGLFEVIGIISGLFSDYQSNLYVLVDAFVCAKFIIYFIGARVLTRNIITEKYMFSLNGFCKFMAIFLLALTLHELLFSPFFPKYDFRYFTYSIQLFFGHPESLSRVCFPLMMILVYNTKKFKNNMIYILALSLVMFFTFRMKALAALFLLYLLYFYFIKLKVKNKSVIFAAGGIGIAYLGYDTFVSYYSHSDYTRTILTVDSFNLANSYFPLGTGFGTFASNIAAQQYSKLYIELGYLNIWGMGKDSEFLSDTFWPILIGETGWIGTFIFLCILFIIVKYVLQSTRKDKLLFIVLICIISYDLISSFGASAFFHPSSLAGYTLFGLLVSINENSKMERKYV